jgi:hypothetical protein
MKQSPLQRIYRVMNYYYKMGHNSERVNKVYKNILKQRYGKEQVS